MDAENKGWIDGGRALIRSFFFFFFQSDHAGIFDRCIQRKGLVVGELGVGGAETGSVYIYNWNSVQAKSPL